MKFMSRLEKLEARAREIEAELAGSGTLRDPAQYQKLGKELADLRPVLDAFERWRKLTRDLSELRRSLADPAADADMKKLVEEEVRVLESTEAQLQTEIENLILGDGGDQGARDIIVEIRAGTGGEEAALFAADLFRMYSKYASSQGLGVEVMDSSPTGKGGLKEMVFGVTGRKSFSLFRFESGIHRVQRVPQTEASGRIHTSAVTVAVLPEADETEVKIDPADLKIDVYRASGAGGQHVNKTESAVRITHLPTGVIVSCQDERSQHKNKAKAMRVLRARLYDAAQAKHHNEVAKQRKEMVGSGDRSGKIRTYNFPDQRVTDHRIGLTLHELDDILDGHLDGLVRALDEHERERKLTDAA